MIEKILEEKIHSYGSTDSLEQENALAEIFQQFILAALCRAGFFTVAGFHGGTFLRIVHGLDRFSEDLDFVLRSKSEPFAWDRYLQSVRTDLEDDGFEVEVLDRSDAETAVSKAFLKTSSIGQKLTVRLPHARDRRRKIQVKLEVDTRPPVGSTFETAFITFPIASALTVQTLESAFASKSHALLCRSYVKGRDWFDFLWYVERGIAPNLKLLGSAVDQVGPWSRQAVDVTPRWYLDRLEETIRHMDWDLARRDVERFLRGRQQEALTLWGPDLFLSQLRRLAQTMDPGGRS